MAVTLSSAAGCKPLAVPCPSRGACRSSSPQLPVRLPASPLRLRAVPKSEDGDRLDGSIYSGSGLPFAATLAAALMFTAAVPEDALAARSGGRVGGSSFSSRRAAPPPRAPPR